MNGAVDPGSPEFYAAVGACGLDVLLEDPFRPFLVIFDDPFPKANKKELIVYKIVDPRGLVIMQEEDGLHYSIRLAYNRRTKVEDVYPSSLIHKVQENYWQ